MAMLANRRFGRFETSHPICFQVPFSTMLVTEKINAVRATRWTDPALTWGLVPTMGYLHAGHLSLVKRARAENDRVAVSIFVNPTQFAAGEDLSTYPRDMAGDLAQLSAENVDLVFTPTPAVMYPAGFQTDVIVNDVSKMLEGASRPTHFKGVATVVAKLFNIVQPTRTYFGQKDAQQTIVLKRMVADLNLNVDLIVMPTIREADGLAMSSRNKYLTAPQREQATVLYKALRAAIALLDGGERDANVVRALMTQMISAESLARLDYVSVADSITLQELDAIDSSALLSLAVHFGSTRLIDNLPWQLDSHL